ncbi:hypothetical protein HDV63DRAFT_29949 [Trichoderma sp. SZMC 28014]
MNQDSRGTGTRGPQLPAVRVMLAPAGVDSELCVDWIKPRHETRCSPIIMEPMDLCQFLFSLGATRTGPRRSHDDASAADSRPLISASWSDPCRWWAAVGEAGSSARGRPLSPQFVSRLDRLRHRHEQDKCGMQVTGSQPCLPCK